MTGAPRPGPGEGPAGAPVLWVDVSDGPDTAAVVGALVAAGASPEEVRAAVDAVTGTPGDAQGWETLRDRLRRAHLAAVVARRADDALGRMSAPRVGVPATVEALAEVIALSAALTALSPAEVVVSSIGVGPMGSDPATATSAGETLDGATSVRTPLDLCLGRRVHTSTRATAPAVVAVVAGEAMSSGPLPPMLLRSTGTGTGGGAGGSATAVLGARVDPGRAADRETVRLLEANVDDLDPRLWPGVLDALLASGAADAWLTPVLMKKGRPAHTLHVLCAPASEAALTDLVLERTTTLGVRAATLDRTVLERTFVDVDVDGVAIPVKVGHRGGRVLTVMPEFDAVTAAAAALGASPRHVLDKAHAAARELVRPGEPPPPRRDG